MIPLSAKEVRRSPLWALGLLGLAACATAGAERIIGPDGAPMLFVHCGTKQSECFRLAGERCPAGYDFAPVHATDTGNFFVRCRRATAGVPSPAPPPAQTFTAPAHPAPAARQNDWPPGVVGSTEPWQTPAPPAVSSVAPASAPPPTPRTHLGEVDIGY